MKPDKYLHAIVGIIIQLVVSLFIKRWWPGVIIVFAAAIANEFFRSATFDWADVAYTSVGGLFILLIINKFPINEK
ncbi:MAG TPA: hypothetical protein PKY29_04390 [Ferruginibacter sp.]|nr:hypothetical protein [Ferruginibacter sp.]HRQ20527.1 hypothetical protein [Ferruginibacter sp.]